MADALGNRSFFLSSVEVFFLVILKVLSLTGNIHVCTAVYTNTRLRTTTSLYIYIIALGVSDLMSAVFVMIMPFTLGVLITGECRVYGPVICHFYAFLDCKTVRIFAYSSTREQSNKMFGTRLKTESETGERR